MKAIDMCREKSFNGTRYECTLIDDCQTLLDRIRLVNKEAKKAKKQMIGEQVEVVVDAAKRIKLKSETIIYLSEILNGSQKKFLQKQINGAVAEKDMTRASRVQVELHNLNVQKPGRGRGRVVSFSAYDGCCVFHDRYPGRRT